MPLLSATLPAFYFNQYDRVAARAGRKNCGRMRDHIIRHTLMSEISGMSPKVGLKPELDELLTPAGLAAYRDTFVERLMGYHRQGIVKVGRTTWTLPYLLRHTAYHVLDHAW